MNLVSFALRRPISLLIAVAAVALAGFLALDRMSRDIFPDLGVPVLYVAQPYGGLDPAQMEGFITNYYEYHFLYITGIEHVESKSIQGVALIKLQFHPGTNMAQATAETVSYVDRARAFMPTGTVPPFVMRFDAGGVPVGDLVFSSKAKTVAELQDAALFRVRPLFATLPGVSAPPPFGSSQRTILVRLDPGKLRSYNMSPDEVVRALAAGNTVSPSGNIRIGDLWPTVPVNSVVGDIKGLNDIPIRSQGTQTIFTRDVGSVEDGADIQTGYALVDGRRTVYIPVTKRADASTLAVVQAVKANLPRFQSVLPDDIKVSYEFDQSPYVTGAIRGLFFEGALGVVLTGLMVLLFLRDWRSSLVVVLNIPLAILASVTALWVSGQTINIMTLGGLALAVGILVDEATVTIENIHTRLADRRSLSRAASEATAETTLPRFVAMLCILAVFIPAFFMTGAAHNLFVPLALAVGFSMVGSYLLSSTFVPVLAVWMLRSTGTHEKPQEIFFDRLRAAYDRFARALMQRRRIVVLSYLIISGAIIVLVGGSLGTEIFPIVVRRSGRQIDLRDVASVTDGTALGEYDRYNMQRMLTLSANIFGEDLGRAAAQVRQAISDTGTPPARVSVTLRGQVQPMAEMFAGLRLGLLMAAGVILLLLAANFQSFRLSLAVGLTIPAVVAGVVLMLWLTGTTLNIQSFMGAIMAIGVAVANAILLVTFAERSRVAGREPWEAAIEGARSRLRPILMTSFAMLAGMVPMALGLGEGGGQSAPLGRAVIGGLIGATCATLVILPAIFATLQSRRAAISASLDPNDPQSRYFEPEPRLATMSDRGDGRAQHYERAAD
jgi:multidrug efflux pump subunit AcrB